MKFLYTTLKSNLPIINFAVSFTALSFQFFILNPWHKQLSTEFNELKVLILSHSTRYGIGLPP